MWRPLPAARPNLRDDSPHFLLYLLTALAVAVGLWGRFKGLGSAPLSADEYYIARSVEDILRTGLPQYDCGGFYTRGLLFQYVSALLQLAGMSPELSARFVAAVSSVLVLPAAYLLGRRIQGRTVGLLAVAVLALSAWSVDIARFGRMYAPFQAVFAWYLVYFVRYTVDRDARALVPMLVLSVAGVFTWEGGVMLTATNLLPPLIRSPEGRFTAGDIRYLVLCGLFVVAAYFVTFTNFRHLGTDPFPPGFDAGEFFEGLEEASPRGAPLNMSTADRSRPTLWTPLGISFGIALLAVAGWSLKWIWSLRRRWTATVALLVVLAGAVLHQFAVVVFVLLAALLARVLSWRDFASRAALPYALAIVSSVLGWTLVALSSPDWLASLQAPWGESSTLLLLAYEFLRIPDFLGVVALPLARAAPVLGAVLFVAIAAAALRCIARDADQCSAERVTLLVIVSLLAVASLGNPPRFETRYVAFLFPVVVVVAVAAAERASRLMSRSPAAAAVALTSVVAAMFAVTGDFNPYWLARVDDPATVLAQSGQERAKPNLLRRSDPRAAAAWLKENATGPGSVTVNAYPTVDFYFRAFDFAYIGPGNHRYWTYACQRGTVERWGNLQLLNNVDALDRVVAGSDRAYIVIDTPSRGELLSGLAARQPRVAWVSPDGRISVLAIEASAAPATR